jgi:hypothetical protein
VAGGHPDEKQISIRSSKDYKSKPQRYPWVLVVLHSHANKTHNAHCYTGGFVCHAMHALAERCVISKAYQRQPVFLHHSATSVSSMYNMLMVYQMFATGNWLLANDSFGGAEFADGRPRAFSE